MINERRVIQRNVFEPVMRTEWARIFWLNPATQDFEWDWTTSENEAFVFHAFDLAETAVHVMLLRGEEHVHSFPHYGPAPVRLGPVSPRECFEALEKRGLA